MSSNLIQNEFVSTNANFNSSGSGQTIILSVTKRSQGQIIFQCNHLITEKADIRCCKIYF